MEYSISFKRKVFFFLIWIFWVFLSAPGLSLVAAGGSFSLVVVHGLSTVVASLVAEHGLQEFRLIDLAVPKHVRSFVNRDRTRVSSVGRRTLNHWPTREALGVSF